MYNLLYICIANQHKDNKKMKIAIAISNKQIKGLVNKMSFSNTLDNFQNYHNASFENIETLDTEEYYLSVNIKVDTNLIYDELAITNVAINNVEIWLEDEEVEVTDEILTYLEKEITNKIKLLA